jgi:hypothetical protein
VTGFSADWLSLREPYDARARNPAVLDALAAAVANHPSIAIVDLACGTGATLRAISSRLPPRQSWRLVDNDLRLLARVASAAKEEDLVTIPIDIARDLEAALDQPVDLVTTSALLDLVSANWLERLAIEISARGLPIYAALTYDGRVTFDPADPVDAMIIEAVNRHQRGDKGFGPALGPTAAIEAIARFEGLNYAVVHGTSDWSLGRSRSHYVWSLFDPRGSRRLLREPDRRALSGKIAIEQHLAVEQMDAHRRTQRLIDSVDRTERETRPAIAKDDWRDDHMQTIETARREEARESVGAALDEHATKSNVGQASEDRCWRHLSVHRRQGKDLDIGKLATRSLCRHNKAANAIVGQ